MRDTIFHVLFVRYPYVCLSAFIFGSLIRFDREQYTWRASSNQLLRRKQLTWGSNLFHVGILFLLVGHTVGLLRDLGPHISSVEQRDALPSIDTRVLNPAQPVSALRRQAMAAFSGETS